MEYLAACRSLWRMPWTAGWYSEEEVHLRCWGAPWLARFVATEVGLSLLAGAAAGSGQSLGYLCLALLPLFAAYYRHELDRLLQKPHSEDLETWQTQQLFLHGVSCLAASFQVSWLRLAQFAASQQDVVFPSALCFVFLNIGFALAMVATNILQEIALPARKGEATPEVSVVEVTESTARAEELAEACSICLRPLGIGEPLTRLHCGHAFHRPCIEGWLRSGVISRDTRICPLRCENPPQPPPPRPTSRQRLAALGGA
ncbi:BRH1 [Symbiodinium microadriaticum]|nr:BRH1 [Symbiodinium microadriaticum]CAE7942713.1 BRH1 [Symbiodinium sp. KB8]